MAEMLELVERAKWGGAHWLIFASTSIGYFIWGLVTALGFLSYPPVPQRLLPGGYRAHPHRWGRADSEGV